MKPTYDQIIEREFPLRDYAADREMLGHMELLEQTSRMLETGVEYRRCCYRRGDGAQVWVYLTLISPDAPVQLAVSAAPLRTLKPVTEHAAAFERVFEKKVLFAMNASYFHFFRGGDFTPYGIQVVNGVELALPAMQDKDKPWYSHNFLAVDRSGRAFICNSNEYKTTWREKLAYAVGGGFRLIRDGKIHLHCDQLGGEYGYAPRTAVAIAEDGTVILLCADGRAKRSAGLCYGDMIEIFLQLGMPIRELLNLDGGGSTTVVLREEDGVHRVQNVPSGPQFPVSYEKYGLTRGEPEGTSQARSVADAVLIIPK